MPQVSVRLKPEAATSLGITPGDLPRMTATMLQGSRVGETYREGRVMAVMIVGQDRWRSEVTMLREMPVWTATGTVLRLEDVADVSVSPSPNVVQREGASRRLDVACDGQGSQPG